MHTFPRSHHVLHWSQRHRWSNLRWTDKPRPCCIERYGARVSDKYRSTHLVYALTKHIRPVEVASVYSVWEPIWSDSVTVRMYVGDITVECCQSVLTIVDFMIQLLISCATGPQIKHFMMFNDFILTKIGPIFIAQRTSTTHLEWLSGDANQCDIV